MPASALDELQLRRLVQAGRSLVARLDLDGVLDELLDTARELTGARYAALGVLDERRRGLERFLTSGVDPESHRRIGDLPRGRGILGVLIEEPRPLRLHRVGDDPRSFGFPPNHPPMGTFLGVPVRIRGEAWGNLYLTEKDGGGDFTDADEQAIVVLADWAAIAIDNARNAAEDRRRHSLRAAEEERRRWARELHDDTLQAMAGVRLLLASALRRGDPETLRGVVRDAVDQLATDIDDLRSLITDLRPAALDQLGLEPALHALAERVSGAHDIEVTASVDLGLAGADRLDPDVESAVYRVVQEALTNAVRHSDGGHVTVAVRERDGRLTAEVVDDGRGFDPDGERRGFGITGMQERVALLGGELAVGSSPEGTVVRASVPARLRPA